MPDNKLISQFDSAYSWIGAQKDLDGFVTAVDSLCKKFHLLMKCAEDADTQKALVAKMADAIVDTGASLRTENCDAIDSMTGKLKDLAEVFLKYATTTNAPADFSRRLSAAALGFYDMKEQQSDQAPRDTLQRRADMLTGLAEKAETLPDPADPQIAVNRSFTASKPLTFKNSN